MKYILLDLTINTYILCYNNIYSSLNRYRSNDGDDDDDDVHDVHDEEDDDDVHDVDGHDD